MNGCVPRTYLLGAASIALLVLTGCGGGGSGGASIPTGGTTITPATISGQYEAIATSSSSPNSVALIEANFTETGTNVFSGKQSVVIIQGTQTSNGITLNGLGGECDNGVLGNDSLQGTFSSATQLPFTLTEAGSLGTLTVTGSATFAADGSQITSGTYSSPAMCGFLSDTGTITGTKIAPFSGAYAGMLANSSGATDAVIVSVSQSALNLTVSGTDNGTPFTVTGSVVGATFDVSGTISSQPVQYVGIYDHVNNSFLVFDSNFNLLGTLKAGTNPQSIPVKAGFLRSAS
jgi:hypothetical protein